MRRPVSGPSDAYAQALLRSVVEIPSPSYAEGELAGHLLGAMRDIGYSAYLDDVGNVIGELDFGPGPTVMLLGHLDTVPEVRPVRLHEGRLYGRGTVDAKGPLTAMVCAAPRTAGFSGRIVVVGAVEEETPGSRGAVHIRDNHPKPDAVVVGEPSGWSGVVLGYRGKLDLSYRVECMATHPSSPAPKATELAAAVWAELVATLGPSASSVAFDRASATLISMAGDMAVAGVEMSVRTPPGFDVDGLLAALRRRGEPGKLDVRNLVSACRVRRTDPVVRALSRAITMQGGVPVAKLRTATSDMNTLAESWSVPMATYGPGDNHLDHTDDEHLVLADFVRSVAVLSDALAELAGELTRTPGEGR